MPTYRVPPWLELRHVSKADIAALLNRLISEREGEVIELLRSAWRTIGREISVELARQILDYQRVPDELVEAIRTLFHEYAADRLAAIRRAGVEKVGTRFMEEAGGTFAVTRTVLDTITRRGDRLAVELSSGVLDMIDWLARYRAAIPTTAAALASELRTFVPLHSRQVEWVVRYAAGLRDNGVHESVVAELANAMAERLREARAMTIARTELAFTLQDVITDGVRQAREQGLFSGDAYKAWDAANDAALCPDCAAMDGETVRFEESFSCGTDPPLHPNCRCVAVPKYAVLGGTL